MNISGIKNRKFITGVLLAVITLSILSVSVYIYKDHGYSNRNGDQREHSEALPYGADGRNIRSAGKMIDMMTTSIDNRVAQMAHQCDRLHIQKKERIKLLEDTYAAGKSAIDKVAASKYTIPFDPHYPPLPH